MCHLKDAIERLSEALQQADSEPMTPSWAKDAAHKVMLRALATQESTCKGSKGADMQVHLLNAGLNLIGNALKGITGVMCIVFGWCPVRSRSPTYLSITRYRMKMGTLSLSIVMLLGLLSLSLPLLNE